MCFGAIFYCYVIFTYLGYKLNQYLLTYTQQQTNTVIYTKFILKHHHIDLSCDTLEFKNANRSFYYNHDRYVQRLKIIIDGCLLTVVACTSGNLVIQVQHGFSLKKIG